MCLSDQTFIIFSFIRFKPHGKKYFYIDIDLTTLKVVEWGISNTATLTGETDDPNIHRIFLTKGQYNKLVQYLENPKK